LPIDATTHRISGLAIREAFDLLQHHDQRQAPGCDLDRMPSVGIEIGTEVLRLERAKLGPQVDIQIAFGKCRLDNSGCGLGNRGERMRTPGHVSPPCRTKTADLSAMEREYIPWRWPLHINQQSLC
jgi:hypothetical protein